MQTTVYPGAIPTYADYATSKLDRHFCLRRQSVHVLTTIFFGRIIHQSFQSQLHTSSYRLDGSDWIFPSLSSVYENEEAK